MDGHHCVQETTLEALSRLVRPAHPLRRGEAAAEQSLLVGKALAQRLGLRAGILGKDVQERARLCQKLLRTWADAAGHGRVEKENLSK